MQRFLFFWGRGNTGLCVCVCVFVCVCVCVCVLYPVTAHGVAIALVAWLSVL